MLGSTGQETVRNRGNESRSHCDVCMEQSRETSFLFPTRPSFSTAHRKRQSASATLRKPLIREFLFYLCLGLLSKPIGSSLCVTREPRLPRICVSI
jgi:hypothetical protein